MRPLSQLLCFCLASMAMASAVQAQDYHQSYTPWKHDQVNNRYTCDYVFHKQNDPPRKQQVIYYPQEQKKDFYYYYNTEKQAYWGRCVSHHNPHHNPQQMQWSTLNNNAWGPVTNDCPLVPGSNGGPQISSPPPPPPPGI